MFRAAAACLALLCGGAAGDTALKLDTGKTFQTFEGWSCCPNPVGYERPFVAWLRDPTVETYDRVPVSADLPKGLLSRMHDALVNDLGFTRVRLEVGPQVEPKNDNDDPRKTDASAYRFLWQDDQIERHILPIRKRIEARKERMTLYISYDLRSKLTPAFLLEPEEYAEMAVAFLAHLKEKYGIEPDYWSVLNEPGNDRPGDPKLCAELTAAAGRRIAAAGFRTRMSGPECVTVAQVAKYMEAMAETPGALDRFAQITYHLYHGGAEDIASRRAVRDWARELKVTAAQTEWMEGSGLDVARHVMLCLREADAVAWDRFGTDLLFALRYKEWLDPASDGKKLVLSPTAFHLKQFTRHIRPGALRVELGGGSGAVSGVAFVSPTAVVLLNTSGEPQAVRIDGLPAGKYGVTCTSEPANAWGREMPDLAAGGALELLPRSVTTLCPRAPPDSKD